jgi:pimeloyl-ACP methyl ester carboxylesterase
MKKDADQFLPLSPAILHILNQTEEGLMKMTRSLCVLLALLLYALSAAAQNRTAAGAWDGTIATPGLELRVIVNLQQKDDRSWAGTIDIPMQGAKALPLTNITVEGASISFSITGIPGDPTFKGTLADDGSTIAGDFTQGPAKFPFKLTRNQTGQAPKLNRPQEPQKPYPYDEREVSYESKKAGIRLAGTLTLPRSHGPFPAVLLITGSGPQDRDEAVAGHKPFLILADHLTRQGVAVLRVDDRGVGGSTGTLATATGDDFADDVVAGVEFLKTRSEINPKQIGLIGHSEGGIIAPLVASQSNDIAFIVLMAGPGIPGDELLYLQGGALLRAAGVSESEIARNRKVQEALFNVVKSERDPAVRISRLQAVRNDLTADLPGNLKAMMTRQLDNDIPRVSQPEIAYILNFDPRLVLAKVKCPVLALNGEKDLQVPYVENLAGIEGALKSGGNTDYTIVHLPDLNHLFQTSKTGMPAEYSLIEETIAPKALNMISEWIAKRTH